MKHEDHMLPKNPAEQHDVQAASEAFNASIELDSVGYEGAFPYLSAFEPELEAA